ncbi:DUF1003 domain-containing protein [Mycoplana sp. MJR14]|uniref:DUF1003 domain-containing protein n=1 Tax=Mycoplana sp. MJR14 TaxID=3032583 RepID=UPI000DD7900F|nr:DUF1003 domain-containing protein [Mycoplana sp. MJR14]MDF1631052.1 DUF1003 domain-containing protein [Mycoplana sp. MJR14]
MGRNGSAARTRMQTCAVCGKLFPSGRLYHASSIRPGIFELIRRDVGEGWNAGSHICGPDLSRYRRRYVADLLEEERGELSDLDRQVLESFERGVSSVHASAAGLKKDLEGETLGQRAADRVAAFGGSWGFIITFVVVLLGWMTINVIGILGGGFDPYPFILLNLVLSCIAALQAPVIMMSQRRQEEKDRLRAENDYMINLRAELEIRQLHDMIEHQMAHQWERLAELQQIQIELLEDRRPPRP